MVVAIGAHADGAVVAVFHARRSICWRGSQCRGGEFENERSRHTSQGLAIALAEKTKVAAFILLMPA